MSLGTMEDSPGIVGDPRRKIKGTDFVIFVSASSTPVVSSLTADHADFDAEVTRANIDRVFLIDGSCMVPVSPNRSNPHACACVRSTSAGAI